MRKKDIMFSYHKESSKDRFEFLYENYYNYFGVLKSRKACTIYMIEDYMSREHWKDYCEKYNSQNRKSVISKISECMDRGEVIDFLLNGDNLPADILDDYKDYIAMRIDFQIFSNALESIGGNDKELLRRYILKEVDLQGITVERTISYETAKGKIRDLKKLLKQRTLNYLREDRAS